MPRSRHRATGAGVCWRVNVVDSICSCILGSKSISLFTFCFLSVLVFFWGVLCQVEERFWSWCAVCRVILVWA
uniref:Uncharacterized protein n=1 Tax=Arundo donax TaxID=35708 RepID=A0A0A9A655_ARUDO